MSESYFTLKEKVSSLVGQQAPDFVKSDHSGFTDFLETYFVFLEAAELQLTDISEQDEILLESDNVASIQKLVYEDATDEVGDTIILEENSFLSAFRNGETVTGSTTGAQATILSTNISNKKLFISAQSRFKTGETITGSASGATATVGKYRANPIQNIQQLLNYTDADKTISDFLGEMRKSFMSGITDNLADLTDKRKTVKNIKDLYKAKGTKKANELFFRLLLNEEADVYYPNRDLLKPSNGDWQTRTILRVTQTAGSLLNLKGQTITMTTSSSTASARCIDVTKFILSGTDVFELELDKNSIDGTFVNNENIIGIDSTDSTLTAKGIIKTIIGGFTITNDGSLYNVNDTITISGGGGTDAAARVEAVGTGPLTDIIISAGGTGYAVGDSVSFSTTNSGGNTPEAVVSVVNGGFAPETGSVSAYSMATDDHIVLEDNTQFLDHYAGNKIVQEAGTSATKDITDIRIVRTGTGYSKPPTGTVTSSGGSGASVIAYGDEIGRIIETRLIDPGVNYTGTPTIKVPINMVNSALSGNVTVGETFTGGTSSAEGTVTGFSNSIVSFTATSGTPVVGETITYSSGTTGVVKKIDPATLTATTGTVVETSGKFISQNGFSSEKAKRIQDSFYYQDYSYVIKVGETIANWRDYIKKAIHPSGFAVSGEVRIQNRVSGQISVPVEGVISGLSQSPLFFTLEQLFSTVFGRRLGTETDGTTLRSNPESDVEAADIDTALASTTRDITLKQRITVKVVGDGADLDFNVGGTEQTIGFAYAGPKAKTAFFNATSVFGGIYNQKSGNLPESSLAFTQSGVPVSQIGTATTVNNRALTIAELQNVFEKVTNASITDATKDTSPFTKWNIAIPAYVAPTGLGFDTTTTSFDDTTITFDKA
tara:strand:+ start:3763 stop:6423 length:2661 start_codon:yes stop_codon:yes gene_type:complete